MALVPALAALLLAGAPAPDASTITVKPGVPVVFRVEEGRPVLLRSGDAAAGKLASGELRAELSVGDGHTMLQLTNNTPLGLNYRAVMHRGHKTAPTSVCTLLSNGRGAFEMWPYAIDEIDLSGFEPAEGDEAACR